MGLFVFLLNHVEEQIIGSAFKLTHPCVFPAPVTEHKLGSVQVDSVLASQAATKKDDGGGYGKEE